MKIKSNLWCQEGDLNPRPPAYETSALNQLSYLDTSNFIKIKNYIIQKIFLKIH